MALIKTISFKKENPLDQDPLCFLKKRLARTSSQEFKNYFDFFNELGTSFQNIPVGTIPNGHKSIFKKIIKPGQCHTNASHLAISSLHHFFHIGFVDSYLIGYNSDSYVGTYQHSFTLYKEESSPLGLCDPTISVRNLLRRDRETLVAGKKYFGVYIPYDILSEVIFDGIEGTPMINISGHLKQNIFSSQKKTSHWIKKLQPFKKTLFV